MWSRRGWWTSRRTAKVEGCSTAPRRTASSSRCEGRASSPSTRASFPAGFGERERERESDAGTWKKSLLKLICFIFSPSTEWAPGVWSSGSATRSCASFGASPPFRRVISCVVMPCRCSQCSPSASFVNPPLFGVPRKCQSVEGKWGQSSSSLSSSLSPPLAVDRKQLSSDAVCHSMCFKAEVVFAGWLGVFTC